MVRKRRQRTCRVPPCDGESRQEVRGARKPGPVDKERYWE